MATFIKVVSGEFPIAVIYSQKEWTTKISFYNNKQLNCISCPIVIKYLFTPNSSFVQRSGGEKKKKKGNYKEFCFSSKPNNDKRNIAIIVEKKL